MALLDRDTTDDPPPRRDELLGIAAETDAVAEIEHVEKATNEELTRWGYAQYLREHDLSCKEG